MKPNGLNNCIVMPCFYHQNFGSFSLCEQEKPFKFLVTLNLTCYSF